MRKRKDLLLLAARHAAFHALDVEVDADIGRARSAAALLEPQQGCEDSEGIDAAGHARCQADTW